MFVGFCNLQCHCVARREQKLGGYVPLVNKPNVMFILIASTLQRAKKCFLRLNPRGQGRATEYKRCTRI